MESLIVPKRKVRVRVRPVDSSALEGHFYTALQTARGTPERLVDRLNDSAEKFLPLALERTHLLICKANIISVEVFDGKDELEPQNLEGLQELGLELQLFDGSKVRGRTFAWMEPARSRALDFLNATAPQFIHLLVGGTVTLVNWDYIVAVSELFGD